MIVKIFVKITEFLFLFLFYFFLKIPENAMKKVEKSLKTI